jgi:hypothetical protein
MAGLSRKHGEAVAKLNSFAAALAQSFEPVSAQMSSYFEEAMAALNVSPTIEAPQGAASGLSGKVGGIEGDLAPYGP